MPGPFREGARRARQLVTGFPGGGTLSCTVTNTAFFEGIPTLDRAGLVLAALLLLFTGLLYVRRF